MRSRDSGTTRAAVGGPHRLDVRERAVLALLASMLVYAPVFRAARVPEALLVLELVALAVLVALVVLRLPIARMPSWSRVALALLCATPLVQLLPVPSALWAALPGASARVEDLRAVGAWPPARLYLSLTPAATEAALWTLLPPLAALFGALALPRRAVLGLVYVLLAVCAIEGLLALAQFQQDETSVLRFGMGWRESAGTYTNRNHLAGLLEMALPISLGLLVASIAHHHGQRGLRLAGLRAAPLALGGAALAIVLGLVFSRSRAGLLLGAFGIGACAIAFGRALLARYVRGVLGSIAALAFAVALLIGSVPVLERFGAEDAAADSRWQTARLTFDTALAHLPFGSGIGSFETVYASVQPLDENADTRMNAAHDDYLQALLEGGLPWGAAMLAGLVAYALRWRELARTRDDDARWTTLRIGAGIGIGLILVHSGFDYNLQVPANATCFALLWGIFLHD